MKAAAPDVVFVFPPAAGHVGAFRNHLGVAYLRAALAETGIESDQYRDDSPGTVCTVADRILRRRPPIVGFTVYDANLSLALALSQRLKQVRPAVKILFGGPAATFGAVRLLEKHSVVDACVLGEAEDSAAPILRQFLGGDDIDPRLPGLAVRRDGVVLASDLPPLTGATPGKAGAQSALDVAPSPYLSGILTDGRSGVLTSRGCTHHCQYCVFAALGRKTLRLHSIERVLAELAVIAHHQKRTRQKYVVSIHDDAFTLLPDRARALCEAIAESDLRLQFSCSTRADRIDDALLGLMRRAGFISLTFGLESAVPSVLRATGKVRPPDWPDPDLGPERDFISHVREGVLSAKRHGFTVGVSIILGLPSETRRDGETTLRFIERLPLDYYVHNFLSVFPGTPLGDLHDRYGIRAEVNELGLLDTTQHAYDVTGPKPRPNCELDDDARLVRLLSGHALYGCGAPGTDRTGIGCAMIRDGALRENILRWLAQHLNVGGLLLQVYPRHAARDAALCFDRDRRSLAHAAVPAGHYAQLFRRPASAASEQWQIAAPGVDLYTRHRPRLLSLRVCHTLEPLLDWCRGSACDTALCDFADDARNVSPMRRHLDAWSETDFSRALSSRSFPPGLTYPGRWLKGRAACLALTRVEIDAAGAVRTCAQGEPIGRVGDDRKTLAVRLDALAAEAERRRGCADCGNTNCSRCPFPDLDDNVYCGLMATQGRLLAFLNRLQLFSRLPLVFALQRARLEAS